MAGSPPACPSDRNWRALRRRRSRSRSRRGTRAGRHPARCSTASLRTICSARLAAIAGLRRVPASPVLVTAREAQGVTQAAPVAAGPPEGRRALRKSGSYSSNSAQTGRSTRTINKRTACISEPGVTACGLCCFADARPPLPRGLRAELERAPARRAAGGGAGACSGGWRRAQQGRAALDLPRPLGRPSEEPSRAVRPTCWTRSSGAVSQQRAGEEWPGPFW
jgi:hypothetical protein